MPVHRSRPLLPGRWEVLTQRAPVKRILHYLIQAVLERRIPYHRYGGRLRSQTPCGLTVSIVREVLGELKATAKLAVIYSDVDRDFLLKEQRRGRVQPLGPVDDLTEEEISESVHIVAQMGLEPIMQALEEGASDHRCRKGI